MVEPILISPYFLNYILPFVLVFTLIFAILQKSKLLGDDAKRINAIIGMVVGLILIASPWSRFIVVELMPFLAVSAVVLLVFMLLYAFVGGKTDGDVLSKPWKMALNAILVIAMVTVLLMITGYWGVVWNFTFGGRGNAQIWVNAFMIIAIAGAIIAVIKGESKDAK
ncbi:hypothetical protein HOE04_05440 [archaeon]|jgi:hypothetical protein|nr:hypothetical protein [archaeon]